MRYNGGMLKTPRPLPARDPVPLLEQLVTLRLANAALHAENAALQERIHELEARLGQDTSNSSRPPSSDPPPAPRNRPVLPSGRQRGGQVGHRGAFRGLLPAEQVDQLMAVSPRGTATAAADSGRVTIGSCA
jgi:transposase